MTRKASPRAPGDVAAPGASDAPRIQGEAPNRIGRVSTAQPTEEEREAWAAHEAAVKVAKDVGRGLLGVVGRVLGGLFGGGGR